MSPLISCIIPVYNGEQYLDETLDSVFAQNYSPLEVVVVDDGSTDGTADLIKARAEEILYLHQVNAGPAAARNAGIAAAAADFLAFVDADDLWLPDKLTRQMTLFDTNPALDVCVTKIRNFWIDELESDREKFKNHPIAQDLPGYGFPTSLIRRRTFDTLGLIDESLRNGEDTDWFMRVIESPCQIELLPEVYVRRRIHRNNMTHDTTAMIDNLTKILKASLDRRRRSQSGGTG